MAWFDNEKRLLLEYKSIEKWFPQFEFGEEYGKIILEGPLHSNKGNYYQIKLKYPNNFPLLQPEPYFKGMEIEGNWYDTLPWFGRPSQHMYTSEKICWNDQNRTHSWDSSKSTGAVVIAAVALWIFSYERYVLDGDIWFASDH